MSTTNRFLRLFMRNTAAACVFAAILALPSMARADEKGVQLLFTQQDTVQAFQFGPGGTGDGYQVGTAVGLISGTSHVSFHFQFLSPTPIGDVIPFAFTNQVTITDIDGDQIAFENDGTGSFHVGVPGAPFIGTGGPLRGTYVVTGATGKYSEWKVGSTFTYKAIATNPPSPAGSLGTVYVEVTFRGRDDLK